MRQKQFQLETEEKACFIFGAGSFYGLWNRPKPGDLVIAADGGLSYLEALGLKPDILLGDFDSLGQLCGAEQAKREAAPASSSVESASGAGAAAESCGTGTEAASAAERMPVSAEIERLPVVKDRSDSAAALLEGKTRGFRRFYLYGCTGGRLDHTIATLQDIAALSKEGIDAFLFSETEVFTAVTDCRLNFPEGMCGTVSVFSHSDVSEGVDESGFLYTVADRQLTNDFPLGLSNAFTQLPASLAVRKGTLLVSLELCGIQAAGNA